MFSHKLRNVLNLAQFVSDMKLTPQNGKKRGGKFWTAKLDLPGVLQIWGLGLEEWASDGSRQPGFHRE